jgi:hypothetical protein
MKVYIAGPYTTGDVSANVAHALEVYHQLLDRGHTPYCPHLSHFAHLLRQRPYEDWMRLDLAWLKECDVLLRLPGESPGAEVEEDAAFSIMPVVYSLDQLDSLAGGGKE